MNVRKRGCEDGLEPVGQVKTGEVFRYERSDGKLSDNAFFRLAFSHRQNKADGDVEAVNIASNETTFFNKNTKVKILPNAEIVHD